MRCAPRHSKATVTVVVEVGSSSPSGDSSEGSGGPVSRSSRSSGGSSIVDHATSAIKELQIKSAPSPVDSARTSTLIAESNASTPSSASFDADPSSVAPVLPPMSFNPYLASSWSMYPPFHPYNPASAQFLPHDYQRAAPFHAPYPSLTSPTGTEFSHPPSPHFPSDFNHGAGPYSSAAGDFPSAQPYLDPACWPPQHYSPRLGYECMPTPLPHPHQQLYYPPPPPPSNGISTPPSPPDYLFPGHFPGPRRLSEDSNDSFGGAPLPQPTWEQPESAPPKPAQDSVMDQLDRGAVMRRSGVTKFFDIQKVRRGLPRRQC